MSMLKKIPQNIGWLVGAIIFAFLIWLLIIKEVDPVISKNFEIPIEYTNEDAAFESGIAVSPLEDTIKIKVTQSRSIISTLSDADFKAVADYGKIYNTQVPVSVTALNRKLSSNDIVQDRLSVEVSVAKIKQIDKVIKCEALGAVAPGYTIGSITSAPGSVSITGPADVLDSIAEVVAAIDVSGANDTKTASAELKFYDLAGNSIDITGSKSVSIEGDAVVSITAEVLIVRNIPIRLDIKDADQLPTGYSLGTYKTEPAEIKLYGKNEAVKKLNEIIIDDVSVAGATESILRNVDIRSYLPEGIMVYESDNEVRLRIDIQAIPETAPTQGEKKKTS